MTLLEEKQLPPSMLKVHSPVPRTFFGNSFPGDAEFALQYVEGICMRCMQAAELTTGRDLKRMAVSTILDCIDYSLL